MKLRGRLERVAKSLSTAQPPLTVVLLDATAEFPSGRRERFNSAGLPVLEIAFDPAGGPVALPPAPFKLVCGVDPVDLV